MGLILRILNETIWEVVIMTLPFVGIAMLVGLIVAIFQATTSIQEPTLTFVPKMLAILLVILIAGSYIFTHFRDFTLRLFELMVTAGK